LLTTVVTIPVAVFVAVIPTPGIKAPVESETVPPNVALLVCANMKLNRAKQTKPVATITRFNIRCSFFLRLLDASLSVHLG
jgi:hypothetical protein